MQFSLFHFVLQLNEEIGYWEEIQEQWQQKNQRQQKHQQQKHQQQKHQQQKHQQQKQQQQQHKSQVPMIWQQVIKTQCSASITIIIWTNETELRPNSVRKINP